jgi:uncharacterized protein Yka (UPF0111/DUF47 family)
MLVDAGVQLADLIRDGLAANDRLKYFLTLLQTATAHARQPFASRPDLRAAREACGVTDTSFDGMPAASRRLSEHACLVPGVGQLRQRLFADLGRMLEPVRAAATTAPVLADRVAAYERRIEAHAAAVPRWLDDQVDPQTIEALTGAGDQDHDTIHRLVMDLHRELNALVATLAIESIDGARVLSAAPQDRALIAAFMRGVNGTAALKFDHPGLGTTAARAGDCLSIQNDLGTTEGHIVVIRVVGLTAMLTYADLHHKRVRFLQDLLEPCAIEWQEAAPAGDGQFETIVGRFAAANPDALEQFLASCGSRLVFLIDWNRARKQIRRFLPNADAIAVLKWAADNDVGHRAFLQAGGTDLICMAFERIAPARIRYGARLDELIGRDAAVAFLKSVLRIAADGLREGHSTRLVQDEVEAELLCRLETPERPILDAVAEHAMLVAALAERLRTVLIQERGAGAGAARARAAALAKAWEARADELVRNSSRTLDRSTGGQILKRLLTQADDVADALEEAAFLLTLAPADTSETGLGGVRGLADLTAAGVKEYVRAIEYARTLTPGRMQPEMEDVLVAVDRIVALERSVDDSERATRAAVLGGCTGFRELHVLSALAGAFEGAADALARCALTMRDYALSLGGER